MTNQITVQMAIVDFIPVVLFTISMGILLYDVYQKYRLNFIAMLTGSLLVTIGGFLKALWKLIYSLSNTDYPVLSNLFFPLQSLGFITIFIALLVIFLKKDKSKGVKTFSLSPIFICGEVVGLSGILYILLSWANRLKKPMAKVFFIISFIAMLLMGYLSSRFDNTSSMHWTAQITNIITNGSLLIGISILHKSELKNFDF
ncbi:MAG: hypothetical protein LIO71_00605 [Ruminococcus sp.]|nr:hypothetical protein [Ruminococcus sp.]